MIGWIGVSIIDPVTVACPNGNAIASTSSSRAGNGAGKPDDECYKCGKKGHWASGEQGARVSRIELMQ